MTWVIKIGTADSSWVDRDDSELRLDYFRITEIRKRAKIFTCEEDAKQRASQIRHYIGIPAVAVQRMSSRAAEQCHCRLCTRIRNGHGPLDV